MSNFWSIFNLLIRLIAQINPLLLCWAKKTYPNLPAPNFLPSLKSSILTKGYSIYLGCLTLEKDPAVDTLSLN